MRRERTIETNAVVIDPSDNVATVLAEVGTGAGVHWQPDGPALEATEPIPSGHKVALVDIAAGQPIRKYGHTIGIASAPIAKGCHVHTHNLTGQEV